MQRLDKILSNMAVGSRKEVKALIRKGVVDVNGVPCLNFAEKVDPAADIITVEGKRVVYKEFVYIMLNKPRGYISATEDGRYPVVTALAPERLAHYPLFPVGRLDVDTEGLMILTNDGQLAHKLCSPASRVPKRYFARLDLAIEAEDARLFAEGLVLEDGYKALPAILEGEGTEVVVTLYEGKFHQVKRMFQTVGKRVVYLKRIQIGGLKLDELLDIGEAREMTEEEVGMLV